MSLPKICGFWGVRAGAEMRGALQLGSSAQPFPRTRPICAVLRDQKKFFGKKTSKQNPEGSRRENRKNEKQIVAASYATRISAANL